jgi:regulator of ribonuclease activity B
MQEPRLAVGEAMRLYEPPLPTLDQLERHFEKMASHGFNMAGPLVWTYSFTHWSRSKLLEFRRVLERKGYRYGGLDAVPRPADAVALFRLTVETSEHQTPAVLLAHLTELCRLASEAGVDYDGWEAGRQPH